MRGRVPGAGCSSPAIILAAAEGGVPKCASGHEPILVGALNADEKVSCKLSDVDLVFPDGTHVSIDPGAYSGSQTEGSGADQRVYTCYSVGIYGFAVGVAKAGCHGVHKWGSTAVLAKAEAAFGKDWPCGH